MTPESVAVATLFERYRSGEPELSSYPELGWEDVPALLALADSAVLLESFPVNPFSSQWQETVPEGVLALWFVEGIRRNDPIGYPSLNPLLLPSGSDRGNWDDLSASSQPAAARAYREWWQAVQSDAEVREHDPLEDTGIGWYGAP